MLTKRNKRNGGKSDWRFLALAILLALAWLPMAARAQVSLSISPTVIPVLPGTTGLSVFGSLTNSGASAVDLDNAYFNLTSGPTGADLTSAFTFSGYSAPFTLSAGQVYSGELFTVDTDPTAPLGTYTGNFAASFGGQTFGQDVTFDLGSPTPVPEASTLPTLAVGLGLLLGILYRRRRLLS